MRPKLSLRAGFSRKIARPGAGLVRRAGSVLPPAPLPLTLDGSQNYVPGNTRAGNINGGTVLTEANSGSMALNKANDYPGGGILCGSVLIVNNVAICLGDALAYLQSYWSALSVEFLYLPVELVVLSVDLAYLLTALAMLSIALAYLPCALSIMTLPLVNLPYGVTILAVAAAHLPVDFLPLTT